MRLIWFRPYIYERFQLRIIFIRMMLELRLFRGTICKVRRCATRAVIRLRAKLRRQTRPATLGSTAPATSRRPSMALVIERQRVTGEKLRRMLASNPAHATRWIERAAGLGLVPAQIVWGQLLLKGYRGVKPDPSAAFHMFNAASTSGDAEALNMVGRCYEQGWGVDVDTRQAIAFFEAAAAAGHTWGKVNLAQMLMRAGDPADRPRCFALFKAAAESGTDKGNTKAMNSLARFLEEGWAGQPDPAGAVFWYGKAAKLGDHWAQFNLATILLRHGDAQAADKWLQHAIAISDNGFRRRIAALLLPRPEPMLRQRGVDALARCAAGGEPEDLYAYARVLDEGVTGHRDADTAAALFKIAASKGHPLAVTRLRKSGKRRRWLPTVLRARAGQECNVKFSNQTAIWSKETA